MQPEASSGHAFFRDAVVAVTGERVAFGNFSLLTSEIIGVSGESKRTPNGMLVPAGFLLVLGAGALGIGFLVTIAVEPGLVTTLIAAGGLAFVVLGTWLYLREERARPAVYWIRLMTQRGPIDLPASPDPQWANAVLGAIRQALRLPPAPPIPTPVPPQSPTLVVGGVAGIVLVVILAFIVAVRRAGNTSASGASVSASSSSADSCVAPLVNWQKACGHVPLHLHNLLGPYDGLGKDGPKEWCSDLLAGKNGSNHASCLNLPPADGHPE